MNCAIKIQTALKAANAPLAPARTMEFRMGVNLGDVMVQEDQIYGDGVNVAAGWKLSQSPVASASQEQFTTRCATNSHCALSQDWEEKETGFLACSHARE